jgi:hypothetical protein
MGTDFPSVSIGMDIYPMGMDIYPRMPSGTIEADSLLIGLSIDLFGLAIVCSVSFTLNFSSRNRKSIFFTRLSVVKTLQHVILFPVRVWAD